MRACDYLSVSLCVSAESAAATMFRRTDRSSAIVGGGLRFSPHSFRTTLQMLSSHTNNRYFARSGYGYKSSLVSSERKRVLLAVPVSFPLHCRYQANELGKTVQVKLNETQAKDEALSNFTEDWTSRHTDISRPVVYITVTMDAGVSLSNAEGRSDLHTSYRTSFGSSDKAELGVPRCPKGWVGQTWGRCPPSFRLRVSEMKRKEVSGQEGEGTQAPAEKAGQRDNMRSHIN